MNRALSFLHGGLLEIMHTVPLFHLINFTNNLFDKLSRLPAYNLHVQCTVYSVQFTVYSLLCTVYCVQFTVYSLQRTIYS